MAAWKTFTHFPGAFEGDGNVWWLDDRDGGNLGERFIRKAVELGIPTICTHKGLSLGNANASPDDIGPVARRHPDVNFVAYHSGFEAGLTEGPYTPETAHLGVNRLIASMEREGIGPNENVYAEIGSTWWYVMRYPDQAAHVLGKLLKHVGRGQRAVGDRLPVLRLTAAADPGDAHVPDLRGAPRAATATRSSRRSSRRRSSG